MIVTVTMNPAVDKTLIVHGFAPGRTNRATIDRVGVGGKGINVAHNLRRLGCEVVATGFLGEESAGAVAAALGEQGIQTDFVRVAGDTRVNVKLLDPLTGVETEINEPGFEVPADAIDALTAKLRALALRASVVVFAGSLPPGAPADLYAQFIRLAGARGARTILDTAGAALRHGIAARPDVAKPNVPEAEELLQMQIRDAGELFAAAQRLLELGAREAVISLGPGGALSASSSGIWRARVPGVAARNTVGAGDAMVAALAYGLTRSLAAPEALRLAIAAGCAAAASADPFPAARDVEALVPHVVIEPMSEVAPSAPAGIES